MTISLLLSSLPKRYDIVFIVRTQSRGLYTLRCKKFFRNILVADKKARGDRVVVYVFILSYYSILAPATKKYDSDLELLSNVISHSRSFTDKRGEKKKKVREVERKSVALR